MRVRDVGFKKKMRWTMSIILIGTMSAAGCSKVQLPHLTGDITIPSGIKNGAGGAGKGTAAGGADGTDGGLEAACEKLPFIKDKPARSVDEYPTLIALIKSLSPMLEKDSKAFAAAHAIALSQTNDAVVDALMKSSLPNVKDRFQSNERKFINRSHPSPERDLTTMITKVMQVKDRGLCASAYLEAFYINFVLALDPMGDISFGGSSADAPKDTLTKSAPLPDDLAKAPTVKNEDGVLRISLPDFQSGPKLDEAIKALEAGHKEASYGVVLFDLRSTGGSDLTVLAKLKSSAMTGWGASPIVLWTDKMTRGAAAVGVAEFSGETKPNVLVIGVDEETYGYGRKLVQKPTTLVEGLSAVTLTIGTELLQPEGFESRSDGYRIQTRPDSHSPRDRSKDPRSEGLFLTLQDALKRARDWKGEAPAGTVAAGDSSTSQANGQANVVSPDANPPVTPTDVSAESVPAPAPPQEPADQSAEPPPGIALSDAPPTTF